ncbi:hypothetical protein HIM_01062 [Hirsutella minnesotensis 3608]|nr:hypothetical protein HIM_01062 [Hirsutella minnesotensis 3608]
MSDSANSTSSKLAALQPSSERLRSSGSGEHVGTSSLVTTTRRAHLLTRLATRSGFVSSTLERTRSHRRSSTLPTSTGSAASTSLAHPNGQRPPLKVNAIFSSGGVQTSPTGSPQASSQPEIPEPATAPESSKQTVTTTVTRVYTVTDCGPANVDCAQGPISTEIVVVTYCPGDGSNADGPKASGFETNMTPGPAVPSSKQKRPKAPQFRAPGISKLPSVTSGLATSLGAKHSEPTMTQSNLVSLSPGHSSVPPSQETGSGDSRPLAELPGVSPRPPKNRFGKPHLLASPKDTESPDNYPVNQGQDVNRPGRIAASPEKQTAAPSVENFSNPQEHKPPHTPAKDLPADLKVPNAPSTDTAAPAPSRFSGIRINSSPSPTGALVGPAKSPSANNDPAPNGGSIKQGDTPPPEVKFLLNSMPHGASQGSKIKLPSPGDGSGAGHEKYPGISPQNASLPVESPPGEVKQGLPIPSEPLNWLPLEQPALGGLGLDKITQDERRPGAQPLHESTLGVPVSWALPPDESAKGEPVQNERIPGAQPPREPNLSEQHQDKTNPWSHKVGVGNPPGKPAPSDFETHVSAPAATPDGQSSPVKIRPDGRNYGPQIPGDLGPGFGACRDGVCSAPPVVVNGASKSRIGAWLFAGSMMAFFL